MDKDRKANYGYWLTRISAFGFILHQYLNFRFKSKVANLPSDILSNPENIEENNGKIIYLNGIVRNPDNSLLIDQEFGYAIPGLILLRSVEMYQWYRINDKFIRKWSNHVIPSLQNPPSYRNPPWVHHSNLICPDDEMILNNISIDTAEVLKVLEFEDCNLKEMTRVPAYSNDDEKTRVFSFKEFVISTEKNGTYKVKYQRVRESQVSVIGCLYNGRVIPYFNIFIQKGDVPLQDLLKQIDTAPDYRITTFLILGFFLGLQLNST